MFIVLLSAVLALMNVYLWKRLVKDTTGPGRTRRILTGVLVALAVLLVATLVVPRFVEVPKSGWYAWPGYLWFGLIAYLFLTLLVLEPLRLALRGWVRRERQAEPADNEPPHATALNRRMFIARASAVAAGAASVGLVGVGAATALGPPNLLQVPVRLRRLDPAFRGFRIAVVSDIHLGPLAGRAHTARIVDTINAAEPDLVAIVGDLVDGTVEELGAAAEPLRDLSAPEGSFFVTGNHEYFVDDTASWLTELERLGVQPLRNENTAIRRGGAAFDLVGVNDITGEARRPARLRPRPGRRRLLASDGPARTPTCCGVPGRRARSGPAAVRAHPRRADVAVPLCRPHGAAVAGRPVDRGRHPAVCDAGCGLLGSAGAHRRAARRHRADAGGSPPAARCPPPVRHVDTNS